MVNEQTEDDNKIEFFKEEAKMESQIEMPVYSTGEGKKTYLDIQAEVGITKHIGGFRVTDELHRLCHLAEAQEVLEVGCGTGIGPAYIAKKFDCSVTAVDISEKMLMWAEKRAQREGVRDKISFRQADVRKLPFEDNRFDAVVVESVLAFVVDKEAAMQELMRVIRPGGYIGITETYWIKPPRADMLPKMENIAPAIISMDEWQKIWDDSGLEDRTFKDFKLDAKQEMRERLQWVGWRSILPAWWRIIKMILTNPSARTSLREQMDTPPEVMKYWGYGLFAGRKRKAESLRTDS
jgi:ubiquinone/menaquinone biosynthesis C-methylase UbiE